MRKLSAHSIRKFHYAVLNAPAIEDEFSDNPNRLWKEGRREIYVCMLQGRSLSNFPNDTIESITQEELTQFYMENYHRLSLWPEDQFRKLNLNKEIEDLKKRLDAIEKEAKKK